MVSEKLKELQRAIADTLLREHVRANEKRGPGSVRLDDDGLMNVAINKAIEKVRAAYVVINIHAEPAELPRMTVHKLA